MTKETINLHGQELDDGRIIITSAQLEGFNLIVQHGEDLESEVLGALRIFLPHYHAVEYRKRLLAENGPHVRTTRHDREMNISAEFALS